MSGFRFGFVRLVAVPLSVLVIGCGRSSAPKSPAEAEAAAKELARQSLAKIDGELKVPGLKAPVDVIRDEWGVPHIYAQNTEDLFFAQGYVTAQDRLWEMDWWRRERSGRLAEVLGPKAFERDRLARLLMYRGPYDDSEWTSYHKDGKLIFTAFANGVNAFIKESAGNLPVEFKLTGLTPEPWTAETAVLREPSFGNASSELILAMAVAKLGVKEANRLAAPDPYDDLKVPDGLDVKLITPEVLAATRGGGGFGDQLPRPEIVDKYKNLVPATVAAAWLPLDSAMRNPGSNNWVIGSAMSPTGKPIVVNDPHRQVTNPSLRYIVHLNAPGWNVVGSGQQPYVGVSMGHNEKLGWGLTISGNDQQDVFVEDLNPSNPNEMMYNGKPEALKVITEEIQIKGEAARKVELKYSRHGPIFYVDEKNHKAYALASAYNQPGTASYAGGLKLDQAQNCKEFLELAMYWKAPTENLICGDVDGNIGWQASALTPKRNGWTGRLPVPGTGKFEWDGFRPDLPKSYNPPLGFIPTANHQIQPPDYKPPMMYKSTRGVEFERIARIRQVIKPGQKFGIEESKNLQHDTKSLRAESEQKLFRGWKAKDPKVESARDLVAKWNAFLDKESAPAAIYITWRKTMDEGVQRGGGLEPPPPPPTRDAVEAALQKTVDKLTADQGPDPTKWQYGKVHTQAFPHPLLAAFDLPTIERRGGNGAVGADGATYREIMDVSNWENSLTINVPGQSTQPESPYYNNLLPLWANDEYFPMVYSREAVDAKAAHKLKLTP